MSAHNNRGKSQATTGMVVSSPRSAHRLGPKARLAILLAAAIILFVAVIGGVIWLVNSHKSSSPTVSVKDNLLKSVQTTKLAGDPQAQKVDANSLIEGAKNGTYKVSNSELAQAYSTRAQSEINLSEYQAALADYQQAGKLDASLKNTSIYGEVLARYKLGERKTLIPLLQQLVDSMKNDHSQTAQSAVGRYEYDIQQLQAGQELDI